MRCPNLPLTPEVHSKALELAREHGREAAARRLGVGVATIERALAFAKLSPLVRKAIERGVAASPSSANTTEALAG